VALPFCLGSQFIPRGCDASRRNSGRERWLLSAKVEIGSETNFTVTDGLRNTLLRIRV
jgi:hypothetical protein